MTRRLLLLPLLLLAGCNWSGEAFYAATEAQSPITAGNYTTSESAHPTPSGTAHISILPDGMTRIEPSGTGHGEIITGFVPLGPGGHFYILWVARFGGEDVPVGGIPYGLLEQRPNGHYMVYLPDCSHDRADALAAGAAPNAEGGDPDCVFPNRASLEAGMRAYAVHPYDGMELIPIR
jgi:hypothetical protein